jgi:type IV pilus assembly protein PilA
MRAIGNKGFTLIELLVVVAIIGILAAIAIPQFAAYRQKGFDAQAESDLRNAATAEEAYFASYMLYKSCADLAACVANLPGFREDTANSTVQMSMTDVGDVSFTGTSCSTSGSALKFDWDSNAGGLQPSTPNTACGS